MDSKKHFKKLLSVNHKQLEIMKKVTVVNQEKYNALVYDVELDLIRNTNRGDVVIIMADGSERCFTGEHGDNDYRQEYGFILEDEKFYIIDATSNSSSTSYVMNESGEIIHTSENCFNFATEQEAERVIEKQGWSSWAAVISE